MTTERPDYCTDEMLEYLDELRKSGATNMYVAGLYLESEFPELTDLDEIYHSSNAACKVLHYWMATFSERQKAEAK